MRRVAEAARMYNFGPDPRQQGFNALAPAMITNSSVLTTAANKAPMLVERNEPGGIVAPAFPATGTDVATSGRCFLPVPYKHGYLELMLYGVADDNDTSIGALWRWLRWNGTSLWIPQLLASWSAIHGARAGLAGASIDATMRFVDTITIAAGADYTGPSGVAAGGASWGGVSVRHNVADGIASLCIDGGEPAVYEAELSRGGSGGTNATSLNGGWRVVVG
ncbi:MAG: hypothetical protein SFZ23_08705 [Planctomycetota bacterium]|nr:hypothetical protein [Planctomycetota bacterium]